MGASLGNGALWINTKNTGAIERVFSLAAGRSLFGTIGLRYGGVAHPLTSGRYSHRDASDSTYIALRPDGPRRTFELHPAYQRVSYTVATTIAVEETTFVPLDECDPSCDSPVVYQVVRLDNRDVVSHRLRIIAFTCLRGDTSADIEAQFDHDAQAILAWNKSDPQLVRLFGFDVAPTRFDTNLDFGSVYDPSHVHALDSTLDATGDIVGALQLDVALEAGDSLTFTVKAAVYANGVENALSDYKRLTTSDDALNSTVVHLEECLRACEILTPDAMINEGALWSKVNMRRVMGHYPQGTAFTNDPGVSSAVVIRDCAWFVYGNDFFMPAFSRALLERMAEKQYPNGKMPEFYNATTGRSEDDGLNINDDTPLYVLAVHHHARASGDHPWLASIFSSVSAAADYIISQTDDRGLVVCTARDPRGNVWAIASWRNIIPLYTINGAVTEINAECVAALREAAEMADRVERPADAERYREASQRIRDAMDRHLINADNGLYYLNIDMDDNAHTDVTGDEIFPVMFQACDDDTAFRIVARLNAPDFWTSAGLRTASRNDPRYDPSASSGLIGGVWPGLTWWYAFAAARYHPEFMVKALRSSFQHYGADPKKNDTVPGQFSEWFDGESLTNKGMRLSPWEPPRFLWAAVEGVCGLTMTHGDPRIVPLVPPSWSWFGVRRVPHGAGSFSYFAVRVDGQFLIYCTTTLESASPVEIYDEDVSDKVTAFAAEIAVVALRSSDRTAILVGNTSPNTVNAPINISDLLSPNHHYHVRSYDSGIASWQALSDETGSALSGFALSVDGHGFRVIEIAV
jgi:hypothetical protein